MTINHKVIGLDVENDSRRAPERRTTDPAIIDLKSRSFSFKRYFILILNICLVGTYVGVSFKVILRHELAVFRRLNAIPMIEAHFSTVNGRPCICRAPGVTPLSFDWWIVVFYDSLLHLTKWVVEVSFHLQFSRRKNMLQFPPKKKRWKVTNSFSVSANG